MLKEVNNYKNCQITKIEIETDDYREHRNELAIVERVLLT